GKIRIRIPKRMLLYLGALPFAALIFKIYSSLLLSWLNGFPAEFVFKLSDVEPWGGQQTGISIVITLILFGPVLFLVFGRRAWCRHLCPIGALLKIFSGASIWKIRLVNDECIGCGKCNNNCDMQIDVMGELKANGEVKSLSCTRCFKCTSDCPKGAIAFSLKRKKISLSSNAIARIDEATLKRRKFSIFDIIISVLWIGIMAVFIFTGINKGAPQEIKVLMQIVPILAIYGLAWMGRKIWLKLRKH
ncbi:MAG: 4Fe-4S binding protein, partial [Actinomycetia bacterium]|nr:4Fe-4S binding protein [Actinomycetes bacterium]